MPLIFDFGVSLVPYNTYTTMQLVSLREACNLPEDAAVALLMFRKSSSGTASYRVADYWHPDMALDTDLVDVEWTVYTSTLKTFLAVNLGPQGSNPDKNIWAGLYSGTTYLYCVGYLTYDDVVIFPEVTSSDRSDYLMTPTESGGSFGHARDSYGEGNIWDLDIMKVQEGKKPTGLLWDGTYDSVKCYPRSVPKNQCNSVEYAPGAFAVHAFDENGDVWVNGGEDAGDEAALMGYLYAPIHWHHLEGSVRSAGFLESGVDHEYEYPEEAEYALFHMPYNMTTWEISQDRQIAPFTDATDASNLFTFNVLSSLNRDKTLNLQVSGTDLTVSELDLMGYFLKKKVVEGLPVPVEGLDVTSPELYVAPDNYGSLHLNYSIVGSGYLFSEVEDLKLYLSGGLGNSDQDLSLGGVQSSTELSSALHSLFNAGTELDSYVGITQYRCLYLENSGSSVARDIRLWVEKELGGTTLEVGQDLVGVDGIATSIPTDEAPPNVESFVLAYSEESCYTIPELEPGGAIPIWFKRVFIPRNEFTQAPDSIFLNLSVLNHE